MLDESFYTPEVLVPFVAGVVLVTSGYTFASYGLKALCFMVGAALGGAAAQVFLRQLETDIQTQYWWVPIVAGGVAGLISFVVLTRVLTWLMFLASFAGGALLKVQLYPNEYIWMVNEVDASPLVAGVVVALAVFMFRKLATILLTSLVGTSLIFQALDVPTQYIYVGVGLGFYIQWLLPRLWTKGRDHHHDRTRNA